MAYIRTPFGASGDKTAIPNDVQPDGSVSQTEGFGLNYQLDPDTDPEALNIPRDKFNQLIYNTQIAVQQYQQFGFPDFITTSDNGGSAFSYSKGAVVRFANGWAGSETLVYYSLVNSNTTTPADNTKWGLVQYGEQFGTGDVLPWFFTTIRAGGWVWLNGTTIGNASSNATQRANADTSALFALLWAAYPTTLAIFDSTGAATTRGLSAAADFAANKAIALPDLCGRTMFGLDNMGGITAKNRITTALSGISGTTLGAAGGAQAVQLTSNQNGQHTHTASTASAGAHTHTGTTDSNGTHTHPATADSAGSHTHPPAPGWSTFIVAGPGGVTSTTSAGAAGNTAQTGSAGEHTHNVNVVSAGAHTHAFTTGSAGAHTHAVTVENSGIGEAHQNMPPAFVGAGYIMKL